MSIEGVSASAVGTGFGVGPSSSYPQQTIGGGGGDSSLQASQMQEPNVLDSLLKGFGERLSSSEADNPFSTTQDELLKNDFGGLVDTSTEAEGTSSQNGNDALIKAFDRSLDMAAATLVVSGFSDSMRQLIRQQ